MEFKIQETPNPNALKFILGTNVKNDGKATFSRPSEAIGLRLAEDLFSIEGVRQLHFFENAITITFAQDIELDTFKLEVQSVLQRDMPVHDAGFLLEDEKKKINRTNLPPDLQKIETILDETVRMYLQGDGGDIEVLSYKEHKVEVRFEGACGTCPSSTAATLDAIQGILQEKFDPLIQVIPV